ncbi:hypothetical protein LPJ71_001948 [Coemansia sp. S17]|nr:hypothetical protein LPJ71_001948 [Coemansia sp. S17]
MTVIPLALAKALSDKLYDKQRAATHKIERLVLDALDADDETLIYQVIAELATDYATSEKEASRIGGLVALAATAVALTHINIRPFLPHMVPPMVSALSDGESKVRYFACESLYNVAKVSRGHILRWFNDIFDGLARVTADSVKTVKDGADYLDRLVKDIVAEQAATCLDWYENIAEGDMEVVPRPHHGPRLAFSLDRFVPLLSERMHTYKPSTRLYLIEWVRVLDSVPGLDLITYLPEFLDGLIRFLSDPSDDVRNKTQSLLGELLSEIRECVEMQGLTEEEEVLPLAGRMRSSTVQSDVYGSSSRRPSRAPSAASIPPSTRLGASTSVTHHHHYHRPGSRLGGSSEMNRSTVSLMTSALVTGAGVDEVRMAARRKKIRMDRQSGLLVPGVAIDFARCVDILVPHLESNDQEIQGLALGWIYQFTWLCPDVMVRGVPRLVNAVLPSVSHPMPALRHTAEDVSQQLYDLVADAADPRQRTEVVSKPAVASASVKPAAAGVTEPTVSKPADAAAAEAISKPTAEPRAVSPGAASLHSVASAAPPSQIPAPRSRTSSVLRTTSPGMPAALPISLADVSVDSPAINHAADDDVSDIEEDHYVTIIDEPFNYEHAATAVMELFAKNVHEPTKVSGMRWLLLLHRKAPWRILTPEDMSFPVLLKMLSDSSEQVVKLDLELFAQISLYSQSMDMPSYLTRFLGSLLQMFATDRVLLETRAALMVRQLCVVLDPQMVFCLFAKLLTMPGFSHQAEEEEDDEYDSDGEEGLADLEFISVMVQHLSWILVTAPETEGLRLLLREYNADLVNHMPPMPSIREAIAKDLPVANRSRGISLSPPVDHHTESNSALDATQQKQTKLVRAPVVPAKQASGRMSAGSTGVRSRNSVVELDKPRSGRPGPSQQQQRRRHAELAALGVRGRNILSACMQRVEHSVEQSRISHDLFCSLFRAWSHNPAACLTLCLLSQHYALGSELISVFGQLTQDLTVSFLVQLDKLVQLIESPVFTYLRLQLLDPSKHPELIRALYGLLMMLPQSSAFAILRNRLSTVAMVPFGLQLQPVRVNQVTGGDQQQQIHYHYHAQPRESDTEVNCSGLLSSATGVAPADLSELLRLLTILATTQPLGDHRPVPSALGLLQQVDEFQQQQQVDSSGTTEQEEVAEPKPVVTFADTQGLVDEYRSVRRRYARALARHQSR